MSSYFILPIQTAETVEETMGLFGRDKLYEDPDFPAELDSIYYSPPSGTKDIEWRRPKVFFSLQFIPKPT